MKIGIDLDDVLGEMVPVFASYHNDMYGTTLTKDDVWSYNFGDVLNISEEEAVRRIYAFERSPKMMDIKPMPGAKRAVDSLRENNHDLYVITARDAEFADITKHWIIRYFPNVFSDVHFANHNSPTLVRRTKGDICKELGITMMIDDSFDNAMSCHGVCASVLLFDAPWNVDKELPNGMHRVSSWDDILRKIA